MSMTLWVRGLLENVFGINTNKLSYRIGGLNKRGHEECLSLDLSPHSTPYKTPVNWAP